MIGFRIKHIKKLGNVFFLDIFSANKWSNIIEIVQIMWYIAGCSIPVHEHSQATTEAAEHDYTRMMGENRTILDGAFVLDPNNKIAAIYVLDSRNL